MLHAILYLDSKRRLRIFDDGHYNREEYKEDPFNEKPLGWCLCDDATIWPDENQALERLTTSCRKDDADKEKEQRHKLYHIARCAFNCGGQPWYKMIHVIRRALGLQDSIPESDLDLSNADAKELFDLLHKF